MFYFHTNKILILIIDYWLYNIIYCLKKCHNIMINLLFYEIHVLFSYEQKKKSCWLLGIYVILPLPILFNNNLEKKFFLTKPTMIVTCL